MSGLFHIIEGAQVITRQKNIFKQRKIYARGNKLFTQHKGGFVGLRKEGRTGDPDLSWDYIEGVQWSIESGLIGAVQIK